jgi:septal ring factor EnvC (AmiA/AmiB activator)
MAIQQDLKPPPRDSDDDMDDLEEPRRRAWGAIASVVLALALVFVGYQWNQAASRAETLAAQVTTLRADADAQRLRAEDLQRQAEEVQKRLVAMGAERDTLVERVASLEKAAAARERAVARAAAQRPRGRSVATAPSKPRATPVSTRVGSSRVKRAP